jgi:hypothetical protein
VADLLYVNQAIQRYGYNYAIKDTSALYFLLSALNYVLYLVDAFVFFVIGVAAVRMAGPSLKKLEDAAVVAAVAGLAGAIVFALANAVVSTIATYISMIIIAPFMSDVVIDSGIPVNISMIGAVVTGIFNLTCCMPVIILFVTVLTIVGGLSYWAIFLNKPPAVV